GGLDRDSVEILGRSLHLRAGSYRQRPDYDDAWFLACARRARRIFDVGANRGYHALLGLLGSDEAEVVLVDASKEALRIAADNLIENDLVARARFVPLLVGDEDATRVRFWTVDGGAAGSVFPQHAASAAARGAAVEVDATTLDRLAERMACAPELLKIDVEGSEHAVLRGATRIATAENSRFLVEMHALETVPMAMNAESVLAWCREVGLRAWYLKHHEELIDPRTIGERGRCHLLLQPASWPYPEWLRAIDQGDDLASAGPAPEPAGEPGTSDDGR
ncbi:MAG: FkbM family methyltransferase, partial [Acidobacteriota bacterium]